MPKITEQDFIKMYYKYNGCQTKLASHYNLSDRSIRNYKAKFIKVNNPISKKDLQNAYCDKLNTVTEIARTYKVSRHVVNKLILEYKLSRDSRYDIEAIRKAYTKNNANISQLLIITGLKNRLSLKKLLDDHNIINPIKQSITDLYIAGLNNTEIAEQLDLTEEQVVFNLKHHSIYKEKKLNISKEELETKRLEKTLEELAAHYSCSTRTISAYIKKYNLPDKPRQKYEFNYNRIKSLYQTLTMDEIADLFGCSRKTINDYIRQQGIESSTRKNSYENKIKEFLQEYNIAFIQNTRKVIAPKELDFYIPSLRLGIEICGLYWHSTKINANKYHIREKYDICKDADIRLITIFEDELLEKFGIVKNRLLSALKRSPAPFYARQCAIKQISARQGIDFLNAHHIQGSGRNNVYLGAFYNDALVAVMSFSKPSIAKGRAKAEWELNRFASVDNIPGVASKLFKFFERAHTPKSIISYADLRWNTGDLYEQLGFTFKKDTKYNYWYVVRQTRKHRFALTKQRLLELYPNADAAQTEQQIAEQHGLYRIYDCGSAVYKWQPL
jgi:DNA-binding CsgD family transcriptional regulator